VQYSHKKLTERHADVTPAFLLQENLRSYDCPSALPQGPSPFTPPAPRCTALWVRFYFDIYICFTLEVLLVENVSRIAFAVATHFVAVLCISVHKGAHACSMLPSKNVLAPEVEWLPVGSGSWVKGNPAKQLSSAKSTSGWGLVCSRRAACTPSREAGGSPQGPCARVEVRGWMLGSNGLNQMKSC